MPRLRDIARKEVRVEMGAVTPETAERLLSEYEGLVRMIALGFPTVEQDELHPPGNSHDPFSDRPEAEAMEHLRRVWPPPADDEAS